MTPKVLMTVENIPYILLPNKVEVVVSNEASGADVNPTAFMFLFTKDGELILAQNRRRGLEIPGGHIEPEDANSMAGAIRECFEETGAVVKECQPVGYFKSTTEGEKPDVYRYPYPISCQQFFAGIVDHIGGYVENDECLLPAVVPANMVKEYLKEQEYLLYLEALKTFFPEIADELAYLETVRKP